MKLYLVHHGEAKPKDEDPDRHLTNKGLRNAEKLAAFLKTAGVSVSIIWHSGKVRARQMAEAIGAGVESRNGVAERTGISPMDSVSSFALEASRENEDVMIVGHFPFLSRLASLLVMGEEESGVVAFDQGAVLCLEREDAAGWRISWLVSPDLLSPPPGTLHFDLE